MNMRVKEHVPGLQFDTKPIRGLLKVELFDAKTKELIQKVEKENMVTNAIKNMLQAYAATNQMGNIMPLAYVGLGGLMMFDEELTADADNIAFPADAHLVGYALQEVNIDNTMRGSKNTVESSLQLGENGRSRTVWDFGTSQANGTIKSLALTKNANPFRLLNNSVVAQPCYFSGRDRHHYYQKKVLAYEDGYAYIVHNISSSSERSGTYGDYTYTRTYTMQINRTYCPMKNYKVGDSATSDLNTPNEVYQTLSWTQVAHNTDPAFNDAGCVQVDFENDYSAYIVWTPGNSTGNGDIYITKITRDNLQWSAENCVITTLTGVQFCNDCQKVVDGHVMAVSYDRRSFYKINLNNLQDVRQITLPEGYYVNSNHWFRSALKGGLLFFGTYAYRTSATQTTTYYRNAILYPDYTIVLDGADADGNNYMDSVNLPFEDGYAFCHSSNGYSQNLYGRFLSNYLGTIANLQTPVVKNASQTLKVTYSLIDA